MEIRPTRADICGSSLGASPFSGFGCTVIASRERSTGVRSASPVFEAASRRRRRRRQPSMRIVGGKVIVCSPGRNFVTVKLETEDGIYGLGDATLNGRELAVASYLGDHVLPLLEGRDARRIEDIWQFLYKGAYWRRGPVTMTAIAAVDAALWDIKGKALGVPVYQLLGGASRDAVLVYGHASGGTIDETVDAVGRYVAAGY